MIVYAALLGVAGLFRLRDDQSGDNLYYMGCLFTLTKGELEYIIFFSTEKYSGRYVAEEAKARDSHAGLWSGAFIAPGDWRSRSKQTVGARIIGLARFVLLSTSP